jgi:hypothetical protein
MSNLILLHPNCHLTHIESRRSWAVENGWLVAGEQDPSEVPVRYRLQQWALLDDAGSVTEIEMRKA